MTTSATSHEAAESIKPHVRDLRRRVCEFIAQQGASGATDEECQIGLGMIGSTQRPRRGEIWAYGLITDQSGERRPTTSGRAATVWHVTDVGIRALGMPADSWCVKTEAKP
jgi:hypothetical protein